MKYSVPMILSIGISGIPFAGADVGGFFGNPEVELLVRWYQNAATQPFYRAHAHIDSKRREPWLFGKEPMDQIRAALRFRYKILHYMFNAFYESHNVGTPIMRPLFFEFPNDESRFGEESHWMTGDSLLSVMVANKMVNLIQVHLPEGNWYRMPFEINFGKDLDKIVAY